MHGNSERAPLRRRTQASGAHFKAAKISAGATIYDGDALVNRGTKGRLHSRFGGSLSARLQWLTLNGHPEGTQAQLQTGAVVFSTARRSL